MPCHLVTLGVEFVVFDNLSTLSDALKDENDATAFKPMQALFSKLKAQNIAAVLIHHSGKAPGARFRGSSNIATTFERIVALRHNDKEPPFVLSACAVIEKYRGKPPPGFSTEVHFTFKTDEGPGGTPVNARWEVNRDESILEDAWRMYRHGGFRTVAEFLDAVNGKHGTKFRPSKFSRDLVPKWILKEPARKAEIEQVKNMMGDRREGAASASDF